MFSYTRFMVIRVTVCLFVLLGLTKSSQAFQINYHDSTKYKQLYELFEYHGEFELKVPDEVFLGPSPELIASEKLGVIVWGEKDRFHVFDSTGRYIHTKDNKGRGPGEITNVSRYSFGNAKRFVVFDQSQFRIVVYDSLYQHDYTINGAGWNVEKITVNQDYIFVLKDFKQRNISVKSPAVTQLSNQGEEIRNWGTIPPAGLLQRNRNGGGIVADQKGNIYYTHLGTHELFKIDLDQEQVLEFSEMPDYYRTVDLKRLKKYEKDHIKRIRYSMELVRLMDVFFLKPDYILQYFTDGAFGDAYEIKRSVEIWNTKGKKIATEVILPWTIEFTMGDRIFIPTQECGFFTPKSTCPKIVFKVYSLKENIKNYYE